MESKQTCALCGKEADLRKSHLIPKLVYRRIKSRPNSRFRSLDCITKEMQDGEKYSMLCADCEEKFSALETYFANHFLDPYLTDGKVPAVDDQINEYILSVAWRILWDDLYRLDSHERHFRDEFESFEEELREYLLNGSKPCYVTFKNSIYKLDDLIQCSETFAEGSLFGYTYYPNAVVGCLVIVYYAGLVFVTQYKSDRRSIVFIDSVAGVDTNLDKIICDEMVRQFTEMIQQEKEGITPELKAKIKKRYGIK